MSERFKYSRSAEIGLSIQGTELFVEYVDAEVYQWRESLGGIDEYETKEELSRYVREAIEDNLDGLAYSIVDDFYERVLGGAGE